MRIAALLLFAGTCLAEPGIKRAQTVFFEFEEDEQLKVKTYRLWFGPGMFSRLTFYNRAITAFGTTCKSTVICFVLSWRRTTVSTK